MGKESYNDYTQHLFQTFIQRIFEATSQGPHLSSYIAGEYTYSDSDKIYWHMLNVITLIVIISIN